MAKPAGSACNLACKYCYYLEKKRLYDSKGKQFMSDSTLERYIQQYIECQPGREVSFVWHGGEPTLRNLEFYRKVIALQKKYAGGKAIFNSLQTNGTLLNDEWCRFLRDNGWLVGLSIDGPPEWHDAYRRDNAGKPSFLRVQKAVKLLNRYGVEWNVMAVVNNLNADHPVEFYNFFKELGCKYIQFTPVVERTNPEGHLLAGTEPEGVMTPFSVTPSQWGDFLIGVFDEWIREDVGKIFIQIFDATLANWVGVEPGLCTLSSLCGHAAVMEHNGDFYCCDHFVFPEYKLGNINSDNILDMMLGDRQRDFAKAKGSGLPEKCRKCAYGFACHGECPRNRFVTTPEGETGHNYLCEGYRRFFAHVAPYMAYMKGELEARRAPANVMTSPLIREIGPNQD